MGHVPDIHHIHVLIKVDGKGEFATLVYISFSDVSVKIAIAYVPTANQIIVHWIHVTNIQFFYFFERHSSITIHIVHVQLAYGNAVKVRAYIRFIILIYISIIQLVYINVTNRLISSKCYETIRMLGNV